ncbi:MAG: archease [bacterium]
MEKAPRNWASRDRAEIYAELDHPADLFLEITGSDLSTLFENALFALYDQVAVLAEFEARRELTITVREASPPDALRALLVEALYLFDTEGFVAAHAAVSVDTAAGPGDEAGDHLPESAAERRAESAGGGPEGLGVTARLWGENADKARHALSTEIKAVTYHQLTVARTLGGDWRATVLFDV